MYFINDYVVLAKARKSVCPKFVMTILTVFNIYTYLITCIYLLTYLLTYMRAITHAHMHTIGAYVGLYVIIVNRVHCKHNLIHIGKYRIIIAWRNTRSPPWPLPPERNFPRSSTFQNVSTPMSGPTCNIRLFVLLTQGVSCTFSP